MTDKYGVWDREHGTWVGLGLGPKFLPFQYATRAEAEPRGPCHHEPRVLTADNLIEGLPYPEAAQKTARVVTEEGLLVAKMDPSLPWELVHFREPGEQL